MTKVRYPFLATLVLLAIAFVAFRWSEMLQRSVLAFGAAPVTVLAPAPQPSLPPVTPQVVVVIVSGLSYQQTRLLSMPIWQNLADVGASLALTVQPPASWPSVWNTLLSGVGPERNGAGLLDPELGGVRPIALDNLLAAARDAGLRTAVAAHASRGELFAVHSPDDLYLTDRTDAAGDADVVVAALGFIAARQHNLIVVHLGQPADAARAAGTAAPAFTNALRQVDSYVRQITHQMNLEDAVLVLTSDGALQSDGRAAGTDNEPPDLPLVMVGQGVVVGAYSPARLQDVAPTLASWLGTRLPAASEGRPLWEMLAPDTNTAARHLALATQQATLADAYVTSITTTSGDETVALSGARAIQEDLARANAMFRSGNTAGAAEMARLVVIEATDVMREARAARQEAERAPRLMPLVVGVVLPWLLFWLRRPPRPGASILGALLAAATFYGLYRLEGNTLAFADALSPYSQIGLPLIRNVAIGLLVGSMPLALGLLSEPEPLEQPTTRAPGGRQSVSRARWLGAAGAGLDYALVTSYLMLLPALVVYWLHGAWITWYLPEPHLVVLYGFALHHLALAALVGPVMAWWLGLVVWAADRLRARTRRRRAEAWDPIAYLRR